MKYQINQIVYFATVRGGCLDIEAMRIDKIEINRPFGNIIYSGECPDDPESIPHVEYEKRLYSSRQDVIAELQRQIDELETVIKCNQ